MSESSNTDLAWRNLGACGRGMDPQQPVLIGVSEQFQQFPFTFGQLDVLANHIASQLSERELVLGDRVALIGLNSVQMIAAILAVMRAGLIAVPLNYRFPETQLTELLADCGAKLLLADDVYLHLSGALPALSLKPDAAWLQLNEQLATRAQAFEIFTPVADEPALILYTSGSTGKPKGVVLSHRAHLWVTKARIEATPLFNERVLIAAPLYHMNALSLIFLSLACRAEVVLLPQFDAKLYIQALHQLRCTWITAVPPMIAMMLQQRELLASADLSAVKVVRMGSAPVTPLLAEQIAAIMPQASVINSYGTTEGGPVVFAPQLPGEPGFRPHPEVQLRLRAGSGELSDEGELELKSPSIMNGYFGRPDLSKVFTADGFYKTGDVFRIDSQGFYHFVGRVDDMFICGGENIFPSQVEQLLEKHPAVRQACVVALPDDIKGQKPAAFVVLEQHQQLTEVALKQFALDNAAAFQHPRHIWFIEALPLAATSKIDRKALTQLALQLVAA